jgi:hypothetical protein
MIKTVPSTDGYENLFGKELFFYHRDYREQRAQSLKLNDSVK